jgi:hypothetical protein
MKEGGAKRTLTLCHRERSSHREWISSAHSQEEEEEEKEENEEKKKEEEEEC